MLLSSIFTCHFKSVRFRLNAMERKQIINYTFKLSIYKLRSFPFETLLDMCGFFMGIFSGLNELEFLKKLWDTVEACQKRQGWGGL